MITEEFCFCKSPLKKFLIQFINIIVEVSWVLIVVIVFVFKSDKLKFDLEKLKLEMPDSVLLIVFPSYRVKNLMPSIKLYLPFLA